MITPIILKKPVVWKTCPDRDHWLNRIIGWKCTCDIRGIDYTEEVEDYEEN